MISFSGSALLDPSYKLSKKSRSSRRNTFLTILGIGLQTEVSSIKEPKKTLVTHLSVLPTNKKPPSDGIGHTA